MSNKYTLQEWRWNKNICRKWKIKRIDYNQTHITRNIKGSSLGWREMILGEGERWCCHGEIMSSVLDMLNLKCLQERLMLEKWYGSTQVEKNTKKGNRWHCPGRKYIDWKKKEAKYQILDHANTSSWVEFTKNSYEGINGKIENQMEWYPRFQGGKEFL